MQGVFYYYLQSRRLPFGDPNVYTVLIKTVETIRAGLHYLRTKPSHSGKQDFSIALDQQHRMTGRDRTWCCTPRLSPLRGFT